MHRTQLLLEPWQYEALKTHSERQGISLSELVRRIVSDYLAPAEPESPLLAMEGIGEDALTTGRDHDQVLYGEPKKRR